MRKKILIRWFRAVLRKELLIDSRLFTFILNAETKNNPLRSMYGSHLDGDSEVVRYCPYQLKIYCQSGVVYISARYAMDNDTFDKV